MRSVLPFTLAVVFSWLPVSAVDAAPPRPNILLIAIDDLNDWVGPLGGHPQVRTPHMDRLAARGVTFTNAHCQSPLCNPSRTSLFTGLRPTTTGIYGLAPWFRSLPEFAETVTLPEHLSANGYRTISVGKVYHGGYPPREDRDREFTELGVPERGIQRPREPFTVTPAGHPLMDWGPFPDKDEFHPDYKIADWAVARLESPPPEPFFLAVGFHLPHVPCFAPHKWFELYPEDELILPQVPRDDRQDCPEFAWYLHWKLPEPRLSWLESSGQWKRLVRAYLASTSFVDAQVGRVLDALEASGVGENTIVIMWSDHGWHLGEKGISGKNSLWDRSTRVPLIVAGPGVVPGARCGRPVELLDIYPTLVEYCRLSDQPGLEGHSLVPLLRDPAAPREWPAITSHNQGNHAIRTERWRYIRYADGSQELYDMPRDPQEWDNLASRPESQAVIAELQRWLPRVDRRPAPGSAHRILEYDPRTGQAVWENEPVVPEQADK